MSSQITEAREGRAISVVGEALGNVTQPAITEISATGKRGMLIAPLHSLCQSDARASAGAGATAQEMSTGSFQGFLLLEENKIDDDPVALRKKWFKKMSGWLLVTANLAASVTYQAGLNPPGGFWQADDDLGHRAGDPVLRDTHWSRYMMFYYFNATAFVTSLVIVALLMSERFYHTEAKVAAFMFTAFIDLISLLGAYTVGSSRYFSSFVYVIIIASIAFVVVIFMGDLMAEIGKFLKRSLPCMGKERSETKTARGSRQRSACCACCACAPQVEGSRA